jgi:hypothetical protein
VVIKLIISRKKILAICAVAVLLLLLGRSANAEKNQIGITVSPAIVRINLDKEEEQLAYVSIKNNYQTRISLKTAIKGVDSEEGILAPIKELDANLKQLLTVNPMQFTLEPRESINLQLRVKNGDALGPGGSYAALVITQLDEPEKLELHSAISVNIFIVKERGARRQLDVVNLKANRLLFGMPSSVNITFKNSGNVLVVPRGVAVVNGGKHDVIYKKGIINEQSISVFPKKNITLNTPLIRLSERWLPAKITISLQYRVEGSNKINTYSTKKLYIPNMYWLIALASFIAFWIIRKYYQRSTKNVYKTANFNG